jgi:hypothetical protein
MRVSRGGECWRPLRATATGTVRRGAGSLLHHRFLPFKDGTSNAQHRCLSVLWCAVIWLFLLQDRFDLRPSSAWQSIGSVPSPGVHPGRCRRPRGAGEYGSTYFRIWPRAAHFVHRGKSSAIWGTAAVATAQSGRQQVTHS